jgi:hypothetical protein
MTALAIALGFAAACMTALIGLRWVLAFRREERINHTEGAALKAELERQIDAIATVFREDVKALEVDMKSLKAKADAGELAKMGRRP